MTITYTPSKMSLVTPKPGILTLDRLKSKDNWRAWLHGITPVIVTVLTTLSITTNDKAAVWVSLFFAVIDPLLSYSNVTDKARKIAYGLGGLLQSGGLLTAALMVAPPTVVPVVSAVITVLTATLSRFYTPTSTMVPKPNAPQENATPWRFPGNPWPAG